MTVLVVDDVVKSIEKIRVSAGVLLSLNGRYREYRNRSASVECLALHASWRCVNKKFICENKSAAASDRYGLHDCDFNSHAIELNNTSSLVYLSWSLPRSRSILAHKRMRSRSRRHAQVFQSWA